MLISLPRFALDASVARITWAKSCLFDVQKWIHSSRIFIWVFPKIGGNPPKWMVYKGKPYEQMDDLVGFPPIFGLTPIYDTVSLDDASF